MKNKELIKKLQDCAAACNHCSDACLGEDNVKMMVDCIRTDRECATVCETTAKLLAMNSGNARKLVSLCAEICRKCAEECGKHDHQHCQDCAKACKECAEACSGY